MINRKYLTLYFILGFIFLVAFPVVLAILFKWYVCLIYLAGWFIFSFGFKDVINGSK